MANSQVKETHKQIISAIKMECKKRGVRVNDAYNQFFRGLFLYCLMATGDGWVLKGGGNVFCRIAGARQTKDLDLYREKQPTGIPAAADSLMQLMNGHQVGPYTFRLTRASKTDQAGPIDTERVTVAVIVGADQKFAQFKIDVSGDLDVAGPAERIIVKRDFDFETTFLPSTYSVYAYPVANQIADKFCAMYERHGKTPPGTPSTRYRDLYDLALIATNLEVEAAELRECLRTQMVVRELTLPAQVTLPADQWATEYAAKARTFGGGNPQFEQVDEALRVVGLLMNPILAASGEESHTTWEPKTLRWVSRRQSDMR